MTQTPTDALRLVPVRATPQMIAAMDKNIFGQKMDLGSDFLHGVWASALAAAPASPLPGGGDEKSEDERFIRDYPEAVRKGDWERIARLLSERLRQMDKRSKAANTRADALIAELKEARGLMTELANELEGEIEGRYAEIKTYPAVAMKYERDMGAVIQARAFLARNGKGEG